jgi:hypothetical protein
VNDAIQLSPETIEAIARRTAEIIRGTPADSDPWLTREQAASYLALPPRTFDRKRKLHPEALKPCTEHPLRWSRNALDVFKLTRGAPLGNRPGRRRQEAMAA